MEDGVYTAVALLARGVDPEKAEPHGLLQGWKTEAPTLRRAKATGEMTTTVFWW